MNDATLERLCRITSNVARVVFRNEVPADCFCDRALFASAVVDRRVLDWIEDAVKIAVGNNAAWEDKE